MYSLSQRLGTTIESGSEVSTIAEDADELAEDSTSALLSPLEITILKLDWLTHIIAATTRISKAESHETSTHAKPGIPLFFFAL